MLLKGHDGHDQRFPHIAEVSDGLQGLRHVDRLVTTLGEREVIIFYLKLRI